MAVNKRFDWAFAGCPACPKICAAGCPAQCGASEGGSASSTGAAAASGEEVEPCISSSPTSSTFSSTYSPKITTCCSRPSTTSRNGTTFSPCSSPSSRFPCAANPTKTSTLKTRGSSCTTNCRHTRPPTSRNDTTTFSTCSPTSSSFGHPGITRAHHISEIALTPLRPTINCFRESGNGCPQGRATFKIKITACRPPSYRSCASTSRSQGEKAFGSIKTYEYCFRASFYRCAIARERPQRKSYGARSYSFGP